MLGARICFRLHDVKRPLDAKVERQVSLGVIGEGELLRHVWCVISYDGPLLNLDLFATFHSV